MTAVDILVCHLAPLFASACGRQLAYAIGGEKDVQRASKRKQGVHFK